MSAEAPDKDARTNGAARGRLRQILYGGNYLDEHQVQQMVDAQTEMGGSLYESLCRQEDLSPVDRAAFFCDLFDHLAYVDVRRATVPAPLLRLVPRRLAEKHVFLPLASTAGTLTIAMANPLDLAALDEISRVTGCDVMVLVSATDEVTEAIEGNYRQLEQEERAKVRLKEFAESEQEMQAAIGQAMDSTRAGRPGQGGAENEENIVRLVELILTNAIHRDASDIHLEPFEKEFNLRYRQDGKLVPVFSGERCVYPPLVSRLKIMANLDIAEHRIPQDGRLKIQFENRDIDFRVSILPTYHGEKVVLRILDKESLKLEFTDLGFEPHERDIFLDAIHKPNGICLVTGPTGSGKSTTLYSALNNLNEDDANLITLEDPVEYNIHGINQVQCNAKVGLTFASGLRSILRQDPDVIMVGEIRDQETADIAVKAALTGHLVLSTLHTNDAPGAVSRLLDMGLEPFMLAASLNLCQAQRLVRRLCPQCKKPTSVPENFLEKHKNQIPEDIENPNVCYVGEGCKRCNGTGYKGRTSVVEMMAVTPHLKDLIAEGATIAQITEAAVGEGMVPLMQNCLRKAFAGITSLEEVLRVTAS
jgi:type IV pilus assembly protein PilB